MQTLQHELEAANPATAGLRSMDHPMFRQMTADPAVAYAEEVRSLRQRVALLEAELAATKATAAPGAQMSRSTIDQAQHRSAQAPASEFTASAAPAVVAVEASPPKSSETVSDPGFAQAWTAETTATTFEERVAEKAFFQASTVDEESRSWLLDD